MKRPTVKDIAQKAGVSVTAVSFVLNNKPGVSKATREKIQKIIDETDFKPNLNSKKLVLNKSFNICLMMNSFSSPFDDLFYFEAGGYHIAVNTVDGKLLEQAKENPVEHRDVMVKISGYSAHFTTLDEKIQDALIERSQRADEGNVQRRD